MDGGTARDISPAQTPRTPRLALARRALLLVSMPRIRRIVVTCNLRGVHGPVAAVAFGDGEQSSSPHNIAKTVSYLRLADGSGTTLDRASGVHAPLDWRCLMFVVPFARSEEGNEFRCRST